jgi:hypothetical protein
MQGAPASVGALDNAFPEADVGNRAHELLDLPLDPRIGLEVALRVGVVEIKTQAGELPDPQQSMMSAVLARGGRVGVVCSAEEMLGLLDAWASRGRGALYSNVRWQGRRQAKGNRQVNKIGADVFV